MASSTLLWLFFAFGHGFWSFLWRSSLIGGLAFVGAMVANLAERKLEREVERVRFDMHRQRGYHPLSCAVAWRLQDFQVEKRMRRPLRNLLSG